MLQQLSLFSAGHTDLSFSTYNNHHHHHHRHNPFWAKVFFGSFCQLSLFLAAFLQFLSPNFLASSVTPSSHLSFGLPLCLLPSTTATRTLLVWLCSSIPITCPAHFNRLILMYVTISLSLYNVYNSLISQNTRPKFAFAHTGWFRRKGQILGGDSINICEKKSSYEHVSNSVSISRKNMNKWRILNALCEILDNDSLELETRSIVQLQLLNWVMFDWSFTDILRECFNTTEWLRIWYTDVLLNKYKSIMDGNNERGKNLLSIFM